MMSSIPESAAIALPSKILAAVYAIVTALALLYVAGFAEIDAVHNGAHDARHSASLPCH